MKKKTFLFITNNFRTGGVETLLVRMANWLVEREHNVTIITCAEGELINLLNNKIRVIRLGFKFNLALFPFISNKIFKNLRLSEIDIIYSFRPHTFLISTLLYRNINKNTILLTGVYHPEEYFFCGKNHFTTIYYSKLFFDYLNDNNKIFMNPGVKKYHEDFSNRKLVFSKIWPIAVNQKVINIKNRIRKKYKIVSIGRLTWFKTYNLYMIDIVKKLRDGGYDVEYEIYGDGEVREKIQEKINKLKCEKFIFLKGELEYSKFQVVLKDAYLFIGMGTAVIEAAMGGVPSLVAIASSNKAICQGYFHELEGYNTGEFLDNIKTYDVYILIRNSFKLDVCNYQKMVEKSIETSKKYSIDKLMIDFINISNSINIKKQLNFPKKSFYYSFGMKFYFHAFIIYVNTLMPRKIMKFLKKYIPFEGNYIFGKPRQ